MHPELEANMVVALPTDIQGLSLRSEDARQLTTAGVPAISLFLSLQVSYGVVRIASGQCFLRIYVVEGVPDVVWALGIEDSAIYEIWLASGETVFVNSSLAAMLACLSEIAARAQHERQGAKVDARFMDELAASLRRLDSSLAGCWESSFWGMYLMEMM